MSSDDKQLNVDENGTSGIKFDATGSVEEWRLAPSSIDGKEGSDGLDFVETLRAVSRRIPSEPES